MERGEKLDEGREGGDGGLVVKSVTVLSQGRTYFILSLQCISEEHVVLLLHRYYNIVQHIMILRFKKL